MAEQQPILSECTRYGEEQGLRALDAKFLSYARGPATQAFDDYSLHARRPNQRLDKYGLTPAHHTGAAIGGMLLRAEADLPGAVADFKARKKVIADISSRQGGGLLRTLTSSLADDTEGAGSILGVYLATNASDDSPDFSIWNTPPSVKMADRFFKGKGQPDSGSSGNVERWSYHAEDDAEKFLRAYLAREHSLQSPDLPSVLAGAYGAVMLRSGALKRAYSGQGIDKQIAERQVEDFVSAATRVKRGQGEQGIVAALGRPEYLTLYKLGAALLERNGVKVRTRFGIKDGMAQAVKTARQGLKPTTVRFSGYTPKRTSGPQMPEEPAETDPDEFKTGKVVSGGRAGTKSGGTHIDRDDSGRPIGTSPGGTVGRGQQHPTTEQPRMATPVRRSGAPERVPAAALVRTPLAILLANESIEDVLKVATQARDRYPHWAQLFAAMRMRSEAGRGTPEEVRVRVGSEDIVARLALAQLERTHVFDRIASGQEVNAEEFAAASEVRRWYARVARGHSTSTRVSAEHARREYWRIVEAQEARLRSVYNIPSALPIEPRMRETLVELYTAHLTRLTDPTNNNVNRGMLELILGRIRRAFFGDYDDEMLTDAARVEWNRVHKVTGRGKKLSPDDLPDLARKQYEQLAKVAGRFGFPAYWS